MQDPPSFVSPTLQPHQVKSQPSLNLRLTDQPRNLRLASQPSTHPQPEPEPEPEPNFDLQPPPTTYIKSEPDPPPEPADPLQAGAVVVGLILLLSRALRLVWGKRYRPPSRSEAEDMGFPLGRIAARHLPGTLLSGDVADVAESAAAVTDYLETKPWSIQEES